VGHESWLERDRLMALDADPEVVGVRDEAAALRQEAAEQLEALAAAFADALPEVGAAVPPRHLRSSMAKGVITRSRAVSHDQARRQGAPSLHEGGGAALLSQNRVSM